MPSATSSSLDIVIIGAGLGGLAAAISCALGGHNVTVLEQARELAEVRCGPLRSQWPTGKEPRLLTGNCKRSEQAYKLHQSKKASRRSGLTRSQ
jgi:flavin-dependent dehydrogenase